MKLKLYIIIYIILFAVSASCKEEGDSISETNINLKEIAKIKVRTAQDIKPSNLGIGCEALDRDFASYNSYKTYLGNLGVKHARFQSGWAKTEKQPGVYDFSWLDVILDDCLSKGIQPWMCISYGNTIYLGAGNEQSSSVLPAKGEALKAWLAYVRKLLGRYKDKIFEWEIWNEPDIKASAKEYAAFYLATAKEIRSIQPNAKLFIGGITSSTVTDYVRSIFIYMQGQCEIGKINGINFHGYPENPDITFSQDLELLEFVKQYGKDIVVRQGESGAPSTSNSWGALSNVEFTELSQAKWDLRRALGTIANGLFFSLFSISELNYPTNYGNSANRLNTKGKLLINSDLSIMRAKQSYYGYQNLCSLFDSDIVPIGRKDELVKSDKRISLYTFLDNQTKSPLLAWWDSAGKPQESLSMSNVIIDLSLYSFEKPVLIDIRTGVIYEVPVSLINGEKINLPAYDSPLLLCDKKLLTERGLL